MAFTIEVYDKDTGICVDRITAYEIRAELDWYKIYPTYNDGYKGPIEYRIEKYELTTKSFLENGKTLMVKNGGYLLYTSVVGIQRKWNHDIKGNELYIRVIDFGQYAGFRNIEKIIIVPEEDIKKFVIQRADHENLVINVNGGTYRDE